MDAKITLGKHCKKKGIDVMKFPEDVWEDMVSEFEDEIDGYLRSCYDAGQFSGYLDNLSHHKKTNKTTN